MLEALLTPQQIELRDEVRRFVSSVPRELLLDMDADRVRYPRELVAEMARRRLLGLRFPPEYGGRGLRWEDEVVALEEMGVLGTSPTCLFSLPSIVGEAIFFFGTEAQKQRYLKPTLEGQLCCAEALTEPRGGSDFFGTTTRARKEGSYYYLQGQKRFVVGSEGADYFLVYARTRDEGPGHQALSAFLVDKAMGVEVKYVYGLLGTRGGGTGRLLFREVAVPEENLVGRENGAAEIFYQMMVPERLTSAAGALGLGRGALEVATRYSTQRMAFGRKIREFQGVSFKIADSVTRLDAARALVYAAARTVDANRGLSSGPGRRLVSEAKKFATEAAWQIVNDCMQVMGGIGYTTVYPLERYLRDCRLALIWTGSNEVMNLIIQHEHYREAEAVRGRVRDVEADAAEAHQAEEKVYGEAQQAMP